MIFLLYINENSPALFCIFSQLNLCRNIVSVYDVSFKSIFRFQFIKQRDFLDNYKGFMTDGNRDHTFCLCEQ